jgi:hypothetical protein
VATFDDIMGQLDGLAHVDGITAVDILNLPPDLQPLLRHMLRHPMFLDEVASKLQLPPEQARSIADKLVDRGFLIGEERGELGEPCYKIYFARTHTRHIPAEL